MKNKIKFGVLGLIFLIMLMAIVKFVPVQAYSMGPFHFDSFECLLQDGSKINLQADVTVSGSYNGSYASYTMSGRIEVPDGWDFDQELKISMRTTLCNFTWQDCIIQLSEDKTYWTLTEPSGNYSERDDGTNYRFGYEYMCTAGENKWNNWVFFYNGGYECIGRFVGTPQGDGQIAFESPAAPSSYDGKKLIGWSLSPTEYIPVNGSAGEDKFHFFNEYNIEEGPYLKVFAHYEEGAVNVSFDPNGGGGTAPGDISYFAGGSFLFPDGTELDREGYMFIGWGDTETAYQDGGTVYQSGDALVLANPGEDKVYYAQWAEVLTVSYDLSGCPGLPPEAGKFLKKTDGMAEAAAAEADGISWTGRDFLGWSRVRGSDTDIIRPGDSFTIAEDTTLYAVWKKRDYTISFHDNGAIEPSGIADMNGTIGDTLNIPSVDLLRDYYIFKGWNDQSDGSGSINCSNGGSLTIGEDTPENLILFAKWEDAPVYTLKFSKGSDDVLGSLPSQGTYYGDGLNNQVSLPKARLTRNGYTFSGWSTSEGGSVVYPDEGSFTITGDTTLYAVWTAGIFTLDYDFNGDGDAVHGSVPDSVQGSLVSGTAAAEQGKMYREYYRFVSWNTRADGNGVTYVPGAVIPLDHNMTLYAKWEPVPPLSVIYHKNCEDGLITVPVDSKSYYADGVHQSGNVSMEQPVRFGYRLAGWNTSEDGTGTGYTFGEAITVTENIDLFAMWERGTYTLTFKKGHSSTTGTAPAAVKSPSDKAVILPNQGGLKRKGYEFTGWNTSADGKGTYYAAGTEYFIMEDTVLYAQWKRLVNVSFDNSEGNLQGDTSFQVSEGTKLGEVKIPAAQAGTAKPVNTKKVYKTQDSDYSAGYFSPVKESRNDSEGDTELTSLEDEKVPLSAGNPNTSNRAYGPPEDCIIHWLILLGIILNILYGILRCRWIKNRKLLQQHFFWDSLLPMIAVPLSAAALLYQMCKWDLLAVIIWIFAMVMILYVDKKIFRRNLEDMETRLLLAEEEYKD